MHTCPACGESFKDTAAYFLHKGLMNPRFPVNIPYKEWACSPEKQAERNSAGC